MSAVRGVAFLMVLGSFACTDVPCGQGMVRVADSCLAHDAGPRDGGDEATPSTSDAGDAGPDGGTPPDGGPSEAGTLPSCAERMIGAYAVRDTSFARGDGIGGDQIFTTVDYKRLTVTVDPDAGLQMTAELCYAETIDVSGSPTQVPSQNLGYLPKETTSPLDLDCDAGTWSLPNARLTFGFAPGVPEGCEGGAATSTNAAGDSCDCPPPERADDVPLPNDANDCRITNEDNDTHPGVTVVTSWLGFEESLYMAFDREGYSAGTLAADGHHTGGWIDTGSENTILGCSQNYGVSCPDPQTAPCTAQGVNEMVFVPRDLPCNAIRTDRAELFKAYPQRKIETNQCF